MFVCRAGGITKSNLSSCYEDGRFFYFGFACGNLRENDGILTYRIGDNFWRKLFWKGAKRMKLEFMDTTNSIIFPLDQSSASPAESTGKRRNSTI